jgi:hypothetical protein
VDGRLEFIPKAEYRIRAWTEGIGEMYSNRKKKKEEKKGRKKKTLGLGWQVLLGNRKYRPPLHFVHHDRPQYPVSRGLCPVCSVRKDKYQILV